MLHHRLAKYGVLIPLPTSMTHQYQLYYSVCKYFFLSFVNCLAAYRGNSVISLVAPQFSGSFRVRLSPAPFFLLFKPLNLKPTKLHRGRGNAHPSASLRHAIHKQCPTALRIR